MPPRLCASCVARKNQAKAENKLGFTLCGDCARALRPYMDLPARILLEAGALSVSCLDDFFDEHGGGGNRHPPPWRWTDHNADALLDGDDRVMLVLAHAGPVAPYVRKLTALAPEMEAALRKSAARLRVLDRAVNEEGGAGPWKPCEEIVETEALLGEIDNAKVGG